jgi:hypothetical protein
LQDEVNGKETLHNIWNIGNAFLEQDWVNSLWERNVLWKGDKHEEGEEWALWMTQWTEELVFVCNFVNFISIIDQ